MKRGLRNAIRDTQKEYWYMSPIQDLNIGEYVVVDVKTGVKDNFGVARVEEVIEATKSKMFEIKPRGVAVARVYCGSEPVVSTDKNGHQTLNFDGAIFEKRCSVAKDIMFKWLARYPKDA